MARIIKPLERVTELVPADDPFPLPSKPQLLEVTPEMASSWLSYRSGHPKLRNLSKDVTARYQSMMESGRTKPGPVLFREATPEGYIFDTEGYIISAQHRLKAQANANVTLLMWIFPDQPREIAPYLDQGFRRSAAHMLVGTPYAKDIGSGAKHLATLADGDRYGMPRFNRVMVPEIVETAKLWPELEEHVAEAWAVWRATKISVGPHLAVLAQAARTDHAVKIHTWLEGLRRGANLGNGDPRLLLREKFHGGFVSLGKVTKRDQVYAVIVKAWNAYATGETISPFGLRLRQGELLPAVEGYSITAKEKAA